MPTRMALERVQALDGDGVLTPTGQQVLDLIGEKSGKNSTVIVKPELEGTGIGGYVDHIKPSEIVLSPDGADAHTLAHEGMHSQLTTDVGAAQMANRVKHGSNYSPLNVNPYSVPREGGAQLRYRHEMEAAPTLLEEASAQGGARGVMDSLGLKNQDRGFGIGNGEYPDAGGVYRHSDGSVDQLAYPLIYRDQAVDQYTKEYGSEFEGKPLGIGIDPRFSEGERDTYYRIGEDSRGRAQRQFDESRGIFVK